MNWKFFECLRQRRTRPATRSVGLVLAIRAKRDDPTCYPSLTSLCKDASVSRHTAIDAINELEQDGLIRVHRTTGKVNRYELLTSADGALVTSADTRRVSPDSDPSSNCTSLAKPVYPSAPVPVQLLDTKGITKGEELPKHEDDDMEVPY